MVMRLELYNALVNKSRESGKNIRLCEKERLEWEGPSVGCP